MLPCPPPPYLTVRAWASAEIIAPTAPGRSPIFGAPVAEPRSPVRHSEPGGLPVVLGCQRATGAKRLARDRKCKSFVAPILLRDFRAPLFARFPHGVGDFLSALRRFGSQHAVDVPNIRQPTSGKAGANCASKEIEAARGAQSLRNTVIRKIPWKRGRDAG
jgi:hypothetical protein